MQSPGRFFNRELSWLEFNFRVLEESENERHPLLERLNFLAISAKNLDEFYMVRVAGLKEQVRKGITKISQDGLDAGQQLEKINDAARRMMQRQQASLQTIMQSLGNFGVSIVEPDVAMGIELGIEQGELSSEDLSWLRQYFKREILPVLSPLAIDPAHPFPFIPNLGMACICQFRENADASERNTSEKNAHEKNADENLRYRYVLVPIPLNLSRFIKLPGENDHRFIEIEELIRLQITGLFEDHTLMDFGVIRLLRDSDLEIAEDAEDLLASFESAVKIRRRGVVIRLKVNAEMSESMLKFVRDRLNVSEWDVVEAQGMVGLASINELISQINIPQLRFQQYKPRFPERINEYGGDCFAAIEAKDIVIHHPYETFDVVVMFLRQAASDPDVVAIKQTLYRTSEDSPIVEALVHAAESGKSVTAVVEIKARFDEEANIKLARRLERAGAQVVYGFFDLKTHCKVSLVVRKNKGAQGSKGAKGGKVLKSYVHLGTGNYHPQTARVYTDLSFFTCNASMCADAAQLFNFLTGYAKPKKLSKLSIAPVNMKDNLLKLIDNEISNAKSGKPSGIWMKMNSLVDGEMIDALYKASQSGVKITIIVRGICALRPGVAGLSENITIKSIVGRFLEHSRIFCFANGNMLPSPEAKVFIASADLMQRNLRRRIEVMVPITNTTVHEQILGQVMVANIRDNLQSWYLQADGSYQRADASINPFCAHDYFMTNPSLSGRGKSVKGGTSKMVTLPLFRS